MQTKHTYTVRLRSFIQDSDGKVIGVDETVVECDTLTVEEISGEKINLTVFSTRYGS